jgi:Flp pilus assembly protein TadD
VTPRQASGAILLLCLMSGSCRGAETGTKASRSGPPPTFANDVAPILYKNCVTCHRPGQAAPWLPEPGEFTFAGERRLSGACYTARDRPTRWPISRFKCCRSKSDSRMLVKAFAARSAQADVAGAELLVRIDSASATAHDYLGRALFAERRPAEAFAHLQRAVALSPNDEVLQIDLGKVLVETGRAAEGIQALRRAIAINPEFSQGYQSLGVAVVRMNRLADAVDAFRRAVALTPESADAHNGLGVALAQSGQQAEALQHFQVAVDLDPDNASARDNLLRARSRKH